MSTRAVRSLGLLNPAAPSFIGTLRPIQQTIPTASKQLTRLSSTTSRPSSPVTLDSNSRPQAPTISPSTGLRLNSTAAPADEVKLDWNSFFKLRASRRRYSLASSVATSLASTAAGVEVLSARDLESLGGAVMGLDPFVVLGLATAACGAAGWLLGPIVGNGAWGLVYRKYKPSVNTVSISICEAILCFVISGPYHFHHTNHHICATEREGVLRPYPSFPCRSIHQLNC